jgi:undecaprenyl-diphosphatase
MSDMLAAAFLGLVEGLTEFIPVSSTGHLILLVDLLGFRGPPGRVFEIVIQFGAILAVCWAYRERLLSVAAGLLSQPRAQRFTLNILVAFLPAMVIGVFAHGFIKSVLFSPWVVAVALVVGGVAILVIERLKPAPTVPDVDAVTPLLALKIGLCQVVAMIPGVSRAGATIMGGVLLGLDRKGATEFSFFLAIPTMLAAASYDLFKNREALAAGGGYMLIAIGFAVAFVTALVTVRTVVGFVGRHGFAPFGWYRIAIGLAMLGVLFTR